jgi:DNA replication ATP-dependent helicase Dna2
MVYIDFQIAKGEASFYDAFISKLERVNLPVYTLDNLNKFANKWANASPLDKDYFAEMIGLVARELLTAKVGSVAGFEPFQGFASLWRNSMQEKLDTFSLLSHLKIKKLDAQNSEIIFERNLAQSQITAFRQGDIIVLYPVEKEDVLEPHKYQLLKGNILEVHPDSVKVRVWHRAVDETFFKKYPLWAIEPNLMESGFNNLFASLSEFLAFNQDKKDLFLGLKRPTFEANFQTDYTHFLSQEQNSILNKALSAKDYFLLQGPPGTGKTSKMLRSMVDYLYHQTTETIVLLAFTNRATDEICDKIKEVCQGDFIRFGNQDNGDFSDQSLHFDSDFKTLKEKVAQNRIFVSTVASFYGNMALIKKFDTIIVDEASQLTEPYLCGILPKFRRFILIGDEKQLPAVVTQPPRFCETNNAHLQSIGMEDLSVSVFERLVLNAQGKGWDEVYDMLSIQFRTHQDIAGFISETFYKDEIKNLQLKIGADYQKSPLTLYNPNTTDETEKMLSQSRVIFIPSQAEENIKFHQGEAQTVVKLLQTVRQALMAKGIFTEESIGVITPYRAQIAEIYKLLDDELRDTVAVDTVERFQGSERDVIIISMAVNHPAQMKNLQAFNQTETVDKKLNVALSRAKEQLILLGNPDILRAGKFYEQFLKYVREKGNVLYI